LVAVRILRINYVLSAANLAGFDVVDGDFIVTEIQVAGAEFSGVPAKRLPLGDRGFAPDELGITAGEIGVVGLPVQLQAAHVWDGQNINDLFAVDFGDGNDRMLHQRPR